MGTIYRINAGDTLTAIARRHHTSVREIMALNGLSNPNMIRTGKVLKLPARPGAAPLTPPPAQEQVPGMTRRPAIARDSLAVGATHALSARDREALIRAVAAEARGERPEVWTAVAQTIINYARRNNVSIHRLVRTSYLSSNFDGNRRYYTMRLDRIPNLEGIRKAVDDAALGRSPIGNRIHFHDTSISTPRYGDRRTRVQIGRIIFYNPR